MTDAERKWLHKSLDDRARTGGYTDSTIAFAALYVGGVLENLTAALLALRPDHIASAKERVEMVQS